MFQRTENCNPPATIAGITFAAPTLSLSERCTEPNSPMRRKNGGDVKSLLLSELRQTGVGQHSLRLEGKKSQQPQRCAKFLPRNVHVFA